MTAQERLVDTNGIRMKMAEDGAGFPLVFVHGLGWDRHLWKDAFARYRGAYRVVAGDTRGHGESDKPPGPYSIRQFADDWRGALDALGIATAAIIGFSQGGMIAMQLAVEAPERFPALVLACTQCRGGRAGSGTMAKRLEKLREQGPRQAARDSAELIFSSRFIRDNPDYIEAFVSKRTAFPPEPLMAAMQAGAGFEICAQLTAYRGAALVMAGAEDLLTRPAAVRDVAESIVGAEFVTVPESGHMLPVEQPSVFYGHLDRFLATAARTSAAQ